MLEWVEERNWFFRLSTYRDFLLRALRDASGDFCSRTSRRNEILSLLDQGLDDVSASRARLGVGVPFPRATSDGEAQTTYVWFDALPNYLTATGFPDTRELATALAGAAARDRQGHHALPLGDLAGDADGGGASAAGADLGARLRESRRRTIQQERRREARARRGDRHGSAPDAFRYFLMREVPFDADGNFSWERFEERYTSDLANGCGNLASRTIAMIEKYRAGVVPAAAPNDWTQRMRRTSRATSRRWTTICRTSALESVWRNVARRKRVRRPAGAVEARARIRRGRRARRDARDARAQARDRRRCSWRRSCPRKAQAVWEQLGGPGAVADQRLGCSARAGSQRLEGDQRRATFPAGGPATA